MTDKQAEQFDSPGDERRSSMRVHSLLPSALRVIARDEIPAIEARILDQAVVETDGALQDTLDWSERSEELPREVIYVLTELRALRQQITEIQRLVEQDGQGTLSPRWISVNDRGFQYTFDPRDPPLAVGDFVEVRLRIPSIHNPDILALGEVVRLEERDATRSAAIVFRAISDLHKNAILRYALRRERQLARSRQKPVFRDDGTFEP